MVQGRYILFFFFFFSSRRRHTRFDCDWSSDVCSSDLNVGMYRIQVIGRNELAMHWQRHKVGAAHWRAMAERGERMPVAVALGGDPASIYAASAPLPPTIDEFLFAGFLRRGARRPAHAVSRALAGPPAAEDVV